MSDLFAGWTVVEVAPDYWVILWANDGGNIFGSDIYFSLDHAVQRLLNWAKGR